MAGVLNQLLPLIKSSSQRTRDDYSPEELLILLIYIYSVTGECTRDTDLGDVEEKVRRALASVFSEESELSPLLQKITGEAEHRCRTRPSVDHALGMRGFCGDWCVPCVHVGLMYVDSPGQGRSSEAGHTSSRPLWLLLWGVWRLL